MKLSAAHELLNRIRLCTYDAVLAQAEQVLQRITEQYFSPNLSVNDIRALVRSGAANADPLKSLGEAWRLELKSMPGVAVQPG